MKKFFRLIFLPSSTLALSTFFSLNPFSADAYGFELVCEARYQTAKDTHPRRYRMSRSVEFHNTHSFKIDGFEYYVLQNNSSDQMSITIKKDHKTLLITKDKLPTFTNNESFTFLRLPDDTDLGVACSFEGAHLPNRPLM